MLGVNLNNVGLVLFSRRLTDKGVALLLRDRAALVSGEAAPRLGKRRWSIASYWMVPG